MTRPTWPLILLHALNNKQFIDNQGLRSLIRSENMRHHFRLGSVIATVDAVNGALHLAQNPESVKQVAIADRLVLTKADIADPGATLDLVRRLRRLNPSAPIVDATRDPWRPDQLMAQDAYDPERGSAEVRGWLRGGPSRRRRARG